jgi:hypothetical protein
MMMDDLQGSVADFVARGWWIFPCRPGRKEPVGGRGFHDASDDVGVVSQWWDEQPDCNVGLHLGKSGLFAVDIEVDEHPWIDKLKTDCTFVQATANGGWHFVFRQPDGWTVPSVPLGQLDGQAEIKGDGGYILLAPSALFGSVAKLGMPTGYKCVTDCEPNEAPDWLISLIRDHLAKSHTERMAQRTAQRMHHRETLHGSAESKVDELVGIVRSAAAGTRSNTLISVAASMGRVVGGGYLSHQEAFGILEDATVGAGWEMPNKTKGTIQRGLELGEGVDPWFPDEVVSLSDEAIADILRRMDEQEKAEAEPPSLALVQSSGVTVQRTGSVLPDGEPASRDAIREELVDRVAQLSGTMADFVELARQCSIYWQPGFCLGGAIALGSVLGSRRLIWPGRNPLTTSCYVLVAGGSGDGKSTAKAPVDLCLEEWSELIGGNSLASFQANFESIRMAAESGHGQLWVLDEYYRVIEQMSGPKASSFNAENRGLLLEMATINGGIYRRKKSKMDSKDGRQFEVVHAPGFSLMALSATERLFEVLGKGSVSDGYLPRHMLFLPQSVLPRKSRGRAPQMSQRLRNAIVTAREVHQDWYDGLGLTVWEGVPVEASDEARAILEGFGDALDDERRGGKSKAPEAVLARGEEQAIRVSMCLAALAQAGQETIRVDAETAYLACDIVAMSLADVAHALTEHTSETTYEAHLTKMRRVLTRCAGPDGWVKWSVVASKLRFGDSQYLHRLRTHLVEAGEVECADTKNAKGGPSGLLLRLVVK